LKTIPNESIFSIIDMFFMREFEIHINMGFNCLLEYREHALRPKMKTFTLFLKRRLNQRCPNKLSYLFTNSLVNYENEKNYLHRQFSAKTSAAQSKKVHTFFIYLNSF